MKISKKDVLETIETSLIVSCQALENEPLHSSFIMGKMAVAAKEGGAKGIRANSVKDIIEIKKNVDLPVIGIIKKVYENCDVFITPTMKEVDELILSGCEIIATDATLRKRPDGVNLEEFIKKIKKKYPEIILMADIATYDEALKADDLGFDLIGSTLRGYTEDTKGIVIPDFDFLEKVIKNVSKPVIAEGGIWTREELKKVMDLGAHAAVIGTAITRPQLITKRFTEYIKK